MPDTIIPDNWYTRTKRHKAHMAEIARLQAQLEAERKLRVDFETWLEARYERLCGTISRGGNPADESEFESCSFAVATWRRLKKRHIGNKETNNGK